MASPLHPEPFFLAATATAGGRRFCVFYAAQGPLRRGQVLYIHPFAEEMNKSRRMAALQARALAGNGFDVLQIDLLGCGDSSGDFGDASWEAWIDDVVLGCQWLLARNNPSGSAPPSQALSNGCNVWLWGLRAGCLLAVEAATQLGRPCNFLFWQPPNAGRAQLQQFLRLKVASEMISGQAKGAMEALRKELAEGRSVEISGYRLSPALANGLEKAVLLPASLQMPDAAHAPRVVWLELSTRPDAEISPVSAQCATQWKEAGFAIESQIAFGSAFWQTQEIEEAPDLLTLGTAALSGITHVPQQIKRASWISVK